MSIFTFQIQNLDVRFVINVCLFVCRETVTKKYKDQLKTAQAAAMIAATAVPTPPVPTTSTAQREKVLLREPNNKNHTNKTANNVINSKKTRASSTQPPTMLRQPRVPEHSLAQLAEGPLAVLEECMQERWSNLAPSTSFTIQIHSLCQNFNVIVLFFF